MGVVVVRDEQRQWADETFGWFTALCAAGFTNDQALALLSASLGRQVMQSTTSPEMSELMTRMSAFFTRTMVEE